MEAPFSRLATALSRAFTLVEMLVVMAVIVILITLVTPSLTGILKANSLTQGSQDIIGQLNLARQVALTQNHPVEVRFYQYADPNFSGEVAGNPASGKFRALQMFTISDTGAATPTNKVEHFPNTFMIDSGPTLSSLLAQATVGAASAPVLTPSPQAYNIPGVDKLFNSVAFRFYPDGSTNLGPPPNGGWFITSHLIQYGDRQTKAPPNFATLQIDPSNGSLREFRP